MKTVNHIVRAGICSRLPFLATSLCVTLLIPIHHAAAQRLSFDFGDAPDSYHTTLDNNGARHRIVDGLHLGERIDAEPTGQPTSASNGDDSNPAGIPSDEDGVVFLTTPLAAGSPARIEVTATEDGLLDAWVDFNADGDWADAGEQIFTSVDLTAGGNSLTFTVPSTVKPGPSHARFRFSSVGDLRFDGPADDGEVEDYSVRMTGPGTVGCEKTTNGRDFWLTFPGNAATDIHRPLHLTLCITGSPGTGGLVEVPGLGFSKSFTIPANGPTDQAGCVNVKLPNGATLDERGVVLDNGVHVIADRNVAVYGTSRIDFSTDSFLGLPSACLGTEYIVLGYKNVWDGFPILNGSQFGIVAITDGTKVEIDASNAAGTAGGAPIEVVLNRGQTYLWRTESDPPADGSGVILTSNQPVGVFAGHRCANINGKNIFFCDQVVEQLLPVKAWGGHYFAAPLATRQHSVSDSKGDTLRIIASEEKTPITITDLTGTRNILLNRAEIHEQIMVGATRVTAQKPVLAAQYSNSSDFDGQVISDPFMTLLQPVPSWLPAYIICSPPSQGGAADFEDNYVNIVVPSGSATTIRLNGNPVPGFQPIGSSGFSYAQVTLNSSLTKHVLHSTSSVSTGAGPVPFGITVYGFSEYDSYGYPGGMQFEDISPPTLICPEEIEVEVGRTCLAAIPDMTGRVTAFDACSPEVGITQTPAAGSLVAPGVHIVTVAARDSNGNRASCDVTVRVVDPNPPKINCPEDISVRCRTEDGTVIFFSVNAFTECEPEIPVVCSPASGTLFPPGTTTIQCEATNSSGVTVTCSFDVVVECEGPELSYQVGDATSELIFSWPAGGVLEHAESVHGPWAPVADATPPHRVATDGPVGFFRVRF